MAAPKLTIVEDKKRGVYCHGLNEVEVHSVDDVLTILAQVGRRHKPLATTDGLLHCLGMNPARSGGPSAHISACTTCVSICAALARVPL